MTSSRTPVPDPPGPFASEFTWRKCAERVGRALTEHEQHCRAWDIYYDHVERGLHPDIPAERGYLTED